MSKPILIVGANYNILQMTDNANSTGRTVAGILDSDYPIGHEFEGYKVVGSELDWDWSENYDYFVGTNWQSENDECQLRCRTRKHQLMKIIEDAGITCTSLIHARALVPDTCKIGQSVMIAADAILGNNCIVGDFSQVREQSYLAHHAHIGKDSIIQVGAYVGSMVEVQDHCYIGVRSVVVPRHDPFITGPLIIPNGGFVKSHQMVNDSLMKSTFKLDLL